LQKQYTKNNKTSQEVGVLEGSGFTSDFFINFENFQKILDTAINYLSQKVGEKTWLHFVDDEGNHLTILAQKRGNRVYLKKIKKRCKEIKTALKQVLKINRGKTNAIFGTLSFSGEYSLLESWQICKDYLSLFFQRLTKKFKGSVYLWAIESHLSGKPHIHFILVLPFSIDYRYDKHKKRGFIKNQDDYDRLKKAIEKIWSYGFVDIQAVSSKDEAVGYITKYIFKANDVEGILNKIADADLNEGVLDESDIKTIFLHYYLRTFKMRQFGVSKRLDKALINKSENCRAKKVKRWVRVNKNPGLTKFEKTIRTLKNPAVIRETPGRLTIICLKEVEKSAKFKFLEWWDIEEGLRLAIMINGLRDLFLNRLSPDRGFSFRKFGSSAWLWLFEVKYNFWLN